MSTDLRWCRRNPNPEKASLCSSRFTIVDLYATTLRMQTESLSNADLVSGRLYDFTKICLWRLKPNYSSNTRCLTHWPLVSQHVSRSPNRNSTFEWALCCRYETLRTSLPIPRSKSVLWSPSRSLPLSFGTACFQELALQKQGHLKSHYNIYVEQSLQLLRQSLIPLYLWPRLETRHILFRRFER